MVSLRADGEGPARDPAPMPSGAGWIEFANAPMTEAEVAAIRLSVRRDRPCGTDIWTREPARVLGLENSLRPRGRQPRGAREPVMSVGTGLETLTGCPRDRPQFHR